MPLSNNIIPLAAHTSAWYSVTYFLQLASPSYRRLRLKLGHCWCSDFMMVERSVLSMDLLLSRLRLTLNQTLSTNIEDPIDALGQFEAANYPIYTPSRFRHMEEPTYARQDNWPSTKVRRWSKYSETSTLAQHIWSTYPLGSKQSSVFASWDIHIGVVTTSLRMDQEKESQRQEGRIHMKRK